MIKPDVALSAHTQLTRPAVLRVDRSKRKDLSLFPGKVDHREEDAWQQSRLVSSSSPSAYSSHHFVSLFFNLVVFLFLI